MKKSSLKTASKVALACSVILAACSTSPQGRKQITAPLPVSEAYSDADMRIQLATASSVSTPCVGVECARNQEFEQQVQSVGYRLALAAYAAYPDLIKRVSEFQFEVAEKSEPGSTSNATGKIVIYRGAQKLDFDEAGVAFLVAREMGHVIGQHHEENSGTRILLSVAVGVLFPALHLFNASAQLAQATQATTYTTLGTTVASTATSYVGSKAILAGLKPDQLSEADAIALNLLEREGWHLHDIASVLNKNKAVPSGSTWAEDFRISMAHLQKLDAEDQSMTLGMQAGPVDPQVMPQEAPDTPAEVEASAVPELPILAQTASPPADEKPVQDIDMPVAASVQENIPAEKAATLAESTRTEIPKLRTSTKLAYSRPAKKHVAGKKPLKSKPLKIAARKKLPEAKPANAKVAAQGKAIKPGPSRVRLASIKPKQTPQ